MTAETAIGARVDEYWETICGTKNRCEATITVNPSDELVP